MSDWTVQKSRELFNIENWGCGYFDLNEEGHVVVRPDGDAPGGATFDLPRTIDEILRRGVETPVLLRFDGILRDACASSRRPSTRRAREFDYGAPYRCVFPIKVNQQRHLVDVLASGGPHGRRLGIEVGQQAGAPGRAWRSTRTAGRLVICNGYKDRGVRRDGAPRRRGWAN